MQTLWHILLIILLLYIGACVAYGAYNKLTRRQKQLNQTFEDMLDNTHRAKKS